MVKTTCVRLWVLNSDLTPGRRNICGHCHQPKTATLTSTRNILVFVAFDDVHQCAYLTASSMPINPHSRPLSSCRSGVCPRPIDKFVCSFHYCVTWDKLRIGSKSAQNSNSNGSLVPRAKICPKRCPWPRFSRDRLGSSGRVTSDEPRVVNTNSTVLSG